MLKQSKTIALSLGNAKEIQTQNGFGVVYFEERVRKDGIRALAAPKNASNLTPFIERGQGGFNWQVEIKPNSSLSTTLVYAGFLDGPVITDASQSQKRKLKFAYNQWFQNIEKVIKFAFDNQKELISKTNQFEKSLQNQNLSPQIKWLLAQAFHSYLGNTWLVYDEEKADGFEYYVWEGEFKYLNTLDVAHDYGVLEGLYFPWVLKLELESWQRSVKKDKKGTVIPHDVGVRFNFAGSQAYKFGDYQIIGMTTYDNDGNSALKEAPDSTYLALKQLAAYASAEEIFKFLGNEKLQQLMVKQTELITESLKAAYNSYGFIPLSLDPSFKEKNQFGGKTVYGTEEQGFAFITGLLYPALTNPDSKPMKEIISLLSQSYPRAYEKSLVRDSAGKVVGLQLAENQALGLGWFSHSLIADVIAEKLFNQKYNSATIFFPLLYDNPYGFADGQYFQEPFYPPQTTLIFYPRGAVLFAYLVK